MGNSGYLLIQPTFRVPELPGDLLEIRARIKQVVRIWMKYREDASLLYRDIHIYRETIESEERIIISYNEPTFENNSHYPTLFFRSGAVIDLLHNLQLDVTGIRRVR